MFQSYKSSRLSEHIIEKAFPAFMGREILGKGQAADLVTEDPFLERR